jgi:lysophospholipase L1-like esterase
VGIVQWQNARLWLWMSWVRPPLPTPTFQSNSKNNVRKFFGVALITCLVLLLATCGGDSAREPTTWNYTALGDSLAFGAIAERGYVNRFADYMESDTGNTVVIRNLAVPGWRSADLLLALQTDSTMRGAVAEANVVTWDIGGNDLSRARARYLEGSCGGSDNQDCLREAVSQFQSNWDSIISELLALRSPQETIFRTMNVYNPFVEIDMATGDFAVLEQFLQQVNEHIRTTATANGILVGDVHSAFNGDTGEEQPSALLAFDQFHPNDAGHETIASKLRELGYSPLK